MKDWIKKRMAGILTGLVIVGAGTAVLANAKGISTLFQADRFRQFDDRYQAEDYDFVAGDGENMDLADKGADGEEDGTQEVLEGDNTPSEEPQPETQESQPEPEPSEEAPEEVQQPKNLTEEGNDSGIPEISKAENTDPSAPKEDDTKAGYEIVDSREDNTIDKPGDSTNNGGNTVTPGGNGDNAGTGGNGDGENGGNSGSGETPGGGDQTGEDNTGKDDAGKDDQKPNGDNTKPNPDVKPDPDPTPDQEESWEDAQLKPRDPAQTQYGTLTGLSAVINRSFYCLGDAFQAEDAVVTASFKEADGSSVTKELSYGDDGYQVVFSTSSTGNKTAVFRYMGMTARTPYKVLSVMIIPKYYAYTESSPDKIFMSDFPGAPLKDMWGEEAYDAITTVKQASFEAVSGNVFNLLEVHRRMIAYLGNAEVKEVFSQVLADSLNSVVFLKEGEDGYLTTMLPGFANIVSGAKMDERTYVYYPASDWGTVTKSLSNIVTAVPDGYKIRRVTVNEGDWSNYTADQVLEQYTGTEETVTVPMGVTKVALQMDTPNSYVKTLVLPESVQSLDIESIRRCFPNLKEYVQADGETTSVGAFEVEEDILYSADGTTLVSVPGGKKEITVPAKVTKLGAGCFAGLGSDCEITFTGDKAPKVEEGGTGFSGKIIVPDSLQDVILKSFVLSFGTESENITFVTESGEENPYVFDEEGSVLTIKGQEQVLAGIRQNTRGLFQTESLPKKYSKIGEGAFAGCTYLTDIEIGENITKLCTGSLILPENVETVTLLSGGIEIDPKLFGDPADNSVPDILIYVKEEDYEDYLEQWEKVLDPVYGEGTAKGLLTAAEGEYLYEDGAKYLVMKKDGEVCYRLLRVYAKNKTAFMAKEGTIDVASDAFEGCTNLEILYLPSVESFDESLISDCTGLETVALGKEALAGEADSASEGPLFSEEKSGNPFEEEDTPQELEILSEGRDYEAFVYEDGVLYGEAEDGSYILLNVRSDHEGTVEVKANTKSLYHEAFRGCSSLTQIAFTEPAKIETIGYKCFEGLELFKELDLSGFTSLKEIDDRAFALCTSLKVMVLPNQLTVLGDGVFYGCVSLKEITLSENLESMGESCFENCAAMEEITLDGKLTGIARYCFYGCRRLIKITVSDSQKAMIKVLGAEAFGQCGTLESLDFSGCTSLAHIGQRAFEGCSKLGSVKLPGSLEEVPDYCFENCTELSIVQLQGSKLKTLGSYIFGESLSEFVHLWVPEELFTQAKESYREQLEEEYGEGVLDRILGVISDKIEIVKGITFELTENGRILKEAYPSLSGTYTVPSDTIRIEDEAFKDCTKLKEIEIKTDTSLELGARAFEGCIGLETAALFGSISNWEEDTFLGCTSLKKAYIGYDGSTIERVGTRAFKGCEALSSAGAVEFRGNIKVIGEEAFKDCVNIPSFGANALFQKSLTEIEDSAFENCASLNNLLTSKYTGLQKMGKYVFRNCDSMQNPSVPAGVKSIGEGCYMDCDKLKTVSFYGALEEYPKDCFKNCPNLTKTGGTAAAFAGLKRIGESAYEGCTSLNASDALKWGLEKYTNLEEIGDRAFAGCTTLSYATLASTLKSIGAEAFDGCTSLGKLTIQAENPPTFGVFHPDTMGEEFAIRVPDSKEEEDVVYLSYLETLTEVLGRKEAFRLLDSESDGAKERKYQADISGGDLSGGDADGTVTDGDAGKSLRMQTGK